MQSFKAWCLYFTNFFPGLGCRTGKGFCIWYFSPRPRSPLLPYLKPRYLRVVGIPLSTYSIWDLSKTTEYSPGTFTQGDSNFLNLWLPHQIQELNKVIIFRYFLYGMYCIIDNLTQKMTVISLTRFQCWYFINN